jgi:hypothetical protein
VGGEEVAYKIASESDKFQVSCEIVKSVKNVKVHVVIRNFSVFPSLYDVNLDVKSEGLLFSQIDIGDIYM